MTIDTYADDVLAVTGSFGSGTTTNDTTPVLNGTLGAGLGAGEVVRIYDGATLIGTANVVGTTWTFNLPALADGSIHSYTAVVEDAAGNQGTASSVFTVTVDTAAPADATAIAHHRGERRYRHCRRLHHQRHLIDGVGHADRHAVPARRRRSRSTAAPPGPTLSCRTAPGAMTTAARSPTASIELSGAGGRQARQCRGTGSRPVTVDTAAPAGDGDRHHRDRDDTGTPKRLHHQRHLADGVGHANGALGAGEKAQSRSTTARPGSILSRRHGAWSYDDGRMLATASFTTWRGWSTRRQCRQHRQPHGHHRHGSAGDATAIAIAAVSRRQRHSSTTSSPATPR